MFKRPHLIQNDVFWPIVSQLCIFFLSPQILFANPIKCEDLFSSAPAPAMQYLRPNSMYDKAVIREAISANKQMVYGAELNSINSATAQTIVQSQSIGILYIDGDRATPSQIYSLTNSIQNASTVVVGRFESAMDRYLKPKIDAGMHGAILNNPENLKDTLTFLRQLYFSAPKGAQYNSFKGVRPVGPAPSSGFLTNLPEMVARANDMMIAGVSIGSKNSVDNIDSIVKAKERGLRLIFVDSDGIAISLGVAKGSAEHLAAVAKVESAAINAGVTLATKAVDLAEARIKYDRGYRQIVIASDMDSIESAFKRFSDIPRDSAKEIEGTSHNIKNLIAKNKVVTVGFLMTPDIKYARALAAKTNALWIDGEHGPFSAPGDIVNLIKSLPADSNVFVRTTWFNNPHIEEYIHAGAKGIIAPSVANAKQTQQFVARVKAANPDTLAIVMVETKVGLRNVEDIARVPGLDILHQGPFDLAKSLNVPFGSVEHQAAVKRVEDAAIVAGVPVGGLAGTRTALYDKFNKGYRFVTTVSDQEAIAGTLKALFGDLGQSSDVNVIKADNQDPMYRYITTTVLQAESVPWQKRDDGTEVKLFSYGDSLSIQLVRKNGTTIVGKTFTHTHREAQITIIEKGRSHMKINGVEMDLGPGDIVLIPPNTEHSFTDMDTDISVIDLLLPRKSTSTVEFQEKH